MPYKIIYDLATQPAVTWRSVALAIGLALAALICAYSVRPGFGRNGLLAFSGIFVLVSVGLPLFDHYQLSHKTPEVVTGLVSAYWEKEWTTRRGGKNQRHSYEAFRVNSISFGYFRHVQMAAFTNTDPTKFPVRNGLAVRIHYLPERQLDDGTLTNRILKLEVAE